MALKLSVFNRIMDFSINNCKQLGNNELNDEVEMVDKEQKCIKEEVRDHREREEVKLEKENKEECKIITIVRKKKCECKYS